MVRRVNCRIGWITAFLVLVSFFIGEYSSFCSADFPDSLQKVPLDPEACLVICNEDYAIFMARLVHLKIETVQEDRMLDLGIERIGELGIVECIGRIVRSEAAFSLRRTVTSLEGCRTIVLDLSEVSALEGGGLGMLIFLERWAHDREIKFKVFNPRKSVRDRLELVRSTRAFDIVTLPEMMALLANADTHFVHAA